MKFNKSQLKCWTHGFTVKGINCEQWHNVILKYVVYLSWWISDIVSCRT